jgi:hypothetical protein
MASKASCQLTAFSAEPTAALGVAYGRKSSGQPQAAELIADSYCQSGSRKSKAERQGHRCPCRSAVTARHLVGKAGGSQLSGLLGWHLAFPTVLNTQSRSRLPATSCQLRARPCRSPLPSWKPSANGSVCPAASPAPRPRRKSGKVAGPCYAFSCRSSCAHGDRT